MKRCSRLPAVLAPIALAASLACVSPAGAAPGLGVPFQVAPAADCVGLAGKAIAWQLEGRTLSSPVAGHIALLGRQAVEQETAIPPPGAADGPCDPAASDASGAEVYALHLNHHGLLPFPDAPLWLARPGAPAQPLGVSGIEPAIALAPDGTGVVAWLAEAGPQPLPDLEPGETRHGPGYVVRAARLRPDGQLEAAQTISGPSAGYEPIPEDAFPSGPVAQAAPDGSLAVAWALLGAGSRNSEVVQAAEAPAGGAFEGPLTLLPAAEGHESLPEDEVQLALAGSGVIAQWQIGYEHHIESAGQEDLLQPFTPAPDLPRLGSEAYELLTTKGDPAGASLSMLRDPEGRGRGAFGALVVVRRQLGQSGQRLETLVPAGGRGRVEGSSLALAPDGAAAAVWDDWTNVAGGATTSRVMLSLAPPGGPFGAPEPVSGLAELAADAAVSFDSSGLLHIAWSTLTGRVGRGMTRGPVYAASAVPGAPDPLAGAAPSFTLHVRRPRPGATAISVSVHVGGPCLVRIQAVPVPGGSSDLDALGWNATRYLRSRGSALLSVALPYGGQPGKGRRLRIVGYASSPGGASSKRTVPLDVPRTAGG